MSVSTEKDALLSHFSVLAYRDTAFLTNSANLPAGWTLKAHSVSPPFAAFAFQNGVTGEVVVAYRGTDGLKDGPADAAIFGGYWDSQFQRGMDFASDVRRNPEIFPDSSDHSKILVTGHSLGGAIAQVVAHAYGLDGSTIDPGAAASIVQTDEFAAAALAAGLPAQGLGAAPSFTNHLVAGSLVSSATGVHLGQTSYLPSLTFSGEQALAAFVVGMVNPASGLAYAIATDQFSNKHSSTQVSQALHLLAGVPNTDGSTVGTITLQPKIIGSYFDPSTGVSKPAYSQVEFEVRDGAGGLVNTIKFSGAGSDRMIEVFDSGGSLQSTTSMAATGTVTVRPVTGSTIVVGYLPAVNANQDGTVTATTTSPSGSVLSSSTTRTFNDGSAISTTAYPGGRSETLTTASDGTLFSREVATPTQGDSQLIERYDGTGNLTSRKNVEYFYDENGVSRMETVLQADGVYRNSYDAEGNPASSYKISDTGIGAMSPSQMVSFFNDVTNLINAAQTGEPIPIVAGGVRLLTTLDPKNASLATAGTVAGGIASFYNLYNAFNTGDSFSKVNASLSTVSFANITLNGEITTAGELVFPTAGGGLNTFLNGSAGGLQATGGTVGVLPVLGLIASIKAKDPIGAAMAIGTMWQGSAFLLSNPVGWVLLAAAFLRAFFDDGPPHAWGVAKVTYGEGFDNLTPTVHTSGENFGPDQVRPQLQNIVDTVSHIVEQNNQANPDSNQHLGLIPQRMPSLTFRASEFADEKGYSVMDIDPLTGAQRIPSLRFDDQGEVFGVLPEQLTAQERNMLTLEGNTDVPPLVAYMLNSALMRGAIAPMWEVKTAKMQEQAGDPNAGLSEEERAAKAGLAAPLDSTYAAAHPSDPGAANKRQGHFMAVGLDMDADGRIDSRTIGQNAAAGTEITFDWDGQGFQKKTGWIGSGDGFLVLDHNFNQSADNAKEMLSNPLIADAAKGLRVLAAYDANGDGKIDASDPVYHQLKVWQDLDQDGNNVNVLTIGGVQSLAQDETGGQKELRSLQEAGITAIDYANGRYEMGAGNYRQIATQTLEAQEEGTRYTPVGAGIQIEVTDGAPQIVITQVQSEEAVYAGLQIAAAGETIGTAAAPLYEDGLPHGFDPHTQGGQREIIIGAAQLLQNDTWANMAGTAAGLTVTSVRGGAHTSVSLRSDGDISLRLEANYNGPAEFFYTVAVPGYEALITPREARVGLNVTSVNDAPVAGNGYAAERPIYGYTTTPWFLIQQGDGGFESANTEFRGVARGIPRYEPYYDYVPPKPITRTIQIGTPETPQEIVQIIGYEPEQYIPHLTPIAADKPNVGHIAVSDPDGGGSFSFQVLRAPVHGTAAVDSAGNWSYVGRRPNALQIPDVNGDGKTDGVSLTGDVTHATIIGQHPGNILSNAYGPDEPAPFIDYFTVRVTDNSDPSGRTFRDVEVAATHYGPPPLPEVTDSGGKKPIAIDLDGDGFHFTDVDDSNVFFDVNGDGWKRRISWVKPGDGLLAFDHDGNGKIERADGISFVPYASEQQTDMSALRAAFDTNNDGRFDAADQEWSSFGVWQDADSDGVTDAGEFKKLEEYGITGIELATDGQFRVIDGQTVHGIGATIQADGSSLAVADVTLRYSNETRVTTVNADGSTTVSTVVVPTYTKGEHFDGTPDKDLVFGTKGTDTFAMHEGDDIVVDDGGNDVIDAGAGNDQVYSGADNDVVYGGAGDDSVFAGFGNDLVFGDGVGEAGKDVIMLQDGNDVAFGGGGDDVISGGSGNDILSGNLGQDVLFGEEGFDALFGQEGDDELWGMDGNDLLYGDIGNDLLSGGAGDDIMEGGAGDDHYQVDSQADSVLELADEGQDTVNASISYTLGANVENLTLVGTAALSGTGSSANNVLVGNDGNNTLTGLAGDDTLDGGLGADLLIGGVGDDTYHIDNAGDRVVETAGQGTDTVRSRITTQLAANVENLTLVGVNAIDGTGNALDNVLVGNTASNVLDGGAGADTMRGGRGDETYLVDNQADAILENAAEGVDTVLASASYALSEHVENLTLVGGAATATGNALDNVLKGNASDNMLDGGQGADTLTGGLGNDVYVVDQAGDQVVELAGEGADTVRAEIDYTLGEHLENLTLTGNALHGTGNSANNALVGNGQNNLLDGAEGADAMAGGLGDDAYLVDDVADSVTEQAASGTDTVYADVSYTLSSHVENLVLTGSADLSGMGNDSANQLTGNTGNNLLDGGAGSDVLTAGAGDDLYVVDNASDLVIEQLGEGNDTVLASVSYGLSANVENLTLTAGGDTDATGNELDNQLIGNSGANRLDGALGADRMAGGAGNDTYIVDNANDAVVELASEGVDTVLTALSHQLAANVENLTLTGTVDVTATGNDLGNVLIGNGGANRLDGAGGADVMAGGSGDDTYVADQALDVVIEEAGAGTDTVLAGVSFTLSANVENLVLTGSGDTAATGNELDNHLAGNAGRNLLDGRAGADAMAGAAGDDAYVVDHTGDTVVELADEGSDLVLASVTYSLADNVDHLTLTGSADIDGTGNALSNQLRGNTGANLLDGRAGADQLAGDAGDDVYVVDDAGDVVVEQAGQGLDTVLASVDYGLSANVENLTLTGTVNTSATGNELDNVLLGNAGVNLLDGAAGADHMAGGAGDDTYIVDNAADAVVERAGEGTDTVLTALTHQLAAHVENLSLTGTADVDGIGNDLDNHLVGNSGANVLDGATGADTMAGGVGDDTYHVDNAGDIVVEQAAEGVDQVLTALDHQLAANVENLTLTGDANVRGTGNDLDNTITGNTGANWLDGAGGADTMAAAAGDDTYVVDHAGDAVVEWLAEGTDTVLSGIDYVLPQHVERLRMTGAARSATGNTQDNEIHGNALGNLIDGAAGADFMAGAEGDDRYVVDNAADVVAEAADEGIDTIEASVSYTLSSEVDNLVLTGTAISGSGNDLNNRLDGNAQNNLMDGAAGADVMAGATGDDTYVVDNTGDTVEELVGQGVDNVLSSVTCTLSSEVENLALVGNGHIAGTGNELANRLVGNVGNNVLSGAAGDDTYEYSLGGGLDTVVDTSGTDTVRFGSGLTLDNVALRIANVNGQRIAQIRVLDASGNEMADQGIDYVMQVDAQNRLTSPLESFVFEDGSSYLWNDLLIQSTSLTGTNGADVLLGGRNDDRLSGDKGNDALYAGSGHDTVLGGDGADVLFAGGGNDKLYGGNDGDELYGEAGNDELLGENGNDYLLDLKGNNTFYGGNHSDVVQAGAGADVVDAGNDADLVDAAGGDDRISAGTGDDWVAAGQGNDAIDTGSGRNLVAFNRGDGADTLSNTGGGRDTISLGGGIRYEDLSLAKTGNDLVLRVGQGESMTIKNWYSTSAGKPIDKLQVVTVGGDYDPASTDKTRNMQTEAFDFGRLVQRFDAARAADASNANGWAVMNSMLDAHLQGSNTAALGGDLSFQYATNDLGGIAVTASQASLAGGSADWQNLKPRSQLEQGSGLKLV